MSSPKIPGNDPLDSFIGRSLKNWLWHQEPPLDSKEKLLQAAQRFSPEITMEVGGWRFLNQTTSLFLSVVSLLFVEQTNLQQSYLEDNVGYPL